MAKIFTFGSNLQGIHGAGAALFAKKYRGAIQGQGEGRQGDSYAIPTKRTPWVTMPLPELERHVERFISYALGNPLDTFELTPVGCGLAGYKPHQIAPLFAECPSNVILPPEFLAHVRQVPNLD